MKTSKNLTVMRGGYNTSKNLEKSPPWPPHNQRTNFYGLQRLHGLSDLNIFRSELCETEQL